MLIGRLGVEQAAALQSKPVQKTIQTGYVIATKSNLNDPNVSEYLYKLSCWRRHRTKRGAGVVPAPRADGVCVAYLLVPGPV